MGGRGQTKVGLAWYAPMFDAVAAHNPPLVG